MPTLAAAVDDFLAHLRSRRSSPNTVKSYLRNDLRQFAREAPHDIEAVEVAHVLAFVGSEAHSAASRQHRHAALSSFFRWLVRQELVATNPMERVDSPKVPARLPRPLAPPLVESILKIIPAGATRDRALFTLVYETRMRIGEALGLLVADVNLSVDDEKVRVMGKGGRERTVLLAAAPRSIKRLRRHLNASGLRSGSLFRGDPKHGGSNLPMDYTTALRAWTRYCRKAGVQATIHQLRHNRATELVAAGVPLATVRKHLGHRNIQSTMIYTEVDAATVRRDLLEYQRRKRDGR